MTSVKFPLILTISFIPFKSPAKKAISSNDTIELSSFKLNLTSSSNESKSSHVLKFKAIKSANKVDAPRFSANLSSLISPSFKKTEDENFFKSIPERSVHDKFSILKEYLSSAILKFLMFRSISFIPMWL